MALISSDHYGTTLWTDLKTIDNYSTDETLMARTQRGDSHAMAMLYKRYSRPLLAFFYRMLGGDGELAEDKLQETFLRLIDRAGLYMSGKKFSTWLYSIAYNICKNEYRRRQVHARGESIEGLLRSGALTAVNKSVDPHDDVTSRLFLEAVCQELENMGAEKRGLFLLRHQQDLSIREIADITGLAQGTVKSRLFHICKFLASRLKHFHPYQIQD